MPKVTESEKKYKASEQRIAILQNTYQAILGFIDKMEELIQFQDKIDVPSDVDQIWDVLLPDIQNLVNIDACALFLVDNDTHEFVLRNVSPPDKGSVCREEIRLQIECGTFSWVISRRQPSIIPSLVFKDNKTNILLPLSTVKRTLGVVLVLATMEESSITRENLRLLTMLAKQCSLVMENTFLYENLKKEHESLQNAQAQILQAEKLASIGRLTAGASHEILNPLNIISSHIQFLLMDKALNPRISKYLNIMREQSERISRVVKGLLQFSRHPEPIASEVRVNDLIEQALSLVGYEIKFENVEIIKQLDPDLPAILGNGENLSQVFFNLLSNARDGMSEGGRLEISTAGKGDFIEIRFQDTGCGIPEENIDKVFDPFFTTKEAGNGTGLGLSVSYGIIRDHGGTISVENGVNQGAVFTIRLPIRM